MLERLLPTRADNTYHGHKLALWLFALLGLAQLMICFVCILALVRYRTMIPAMFMLLLLHELGRHVVFHFLPVARTGTPPGPVVNLTLLGVMIAGLALSLRSRDTRQAALGETVDAEFKRPKAI